jgi:predicted membrane channel-forming protein YqfA (hemolysin III family)
MTALVSLLSNFVSFATSSLCHYMRNPGTKLASICFLVDYIAIVLHIWAASLSVLLLEAAGRNVSNGLIFGITLAGMLCVTQLMLWPRVKRQRVLAIGVFGTLALCAVTVYNIIFSSMSGLTVSYILLALINGLGGWFYSRGSIRFSRGSLELYMVSGHLLMHLCSLIASIFHASTLASVCCIAT